jgi:D-alanyl-lipoteichoic acid acyltransferase DltB (MBOAT superfamily)
MLFNSFPFLLAFLPAALLLHWAVERFRPDWRIGVLVALSFVFYGWWDWRFVPLLAGSIAVNWWVAERFIGSRRNVLITAALVGNLALLGLFKYAAFAIGLSISCRVSNSTSPRSRCRSASPSSPSTT